MITTLDKVTALIIIDLQKGIISRQKESVVKPLLSKASELVAAFRKVQLPIVLVNVDPTKAKYLKARTDEKAIPKNSIVQSLLKTALPLTGFSNIVPELNSKPEDIFITKHGWGAFFETNLQEELQKRNVTNIVLAGIATSIGVESTARQAGELGYNITFAVDAMTDSKEEAHHNSIQFIFPRIGEVGNTADIVKVLSSR